MELDRSNIVKKINVFSIENNKDELINLLCDILESEKYMDYYDLIIIIINLAELYGYFEFMKKLGKNQLSSFDIYQISNSLRKELYKSKKDNEIFYNSGQLSLLEELKNFDKVFISAPTSFGKTSLILEHITTNSKFYKTIVFLSPTNALVEELYIKFLRLNKDNSLGYHILTTPNKTKDKSIWILTPEKFLLLIEEQSPKFDLIVMDEAYKIEDEELIDKNDILNSRSSKYRKVMEYMANYNSKIIFLSPYTYNKAPSMQRFIEKYNVKVIDRNINYVKKEIIDIYDSKSYKNNFGNNHITIRKQESGVKKAIAALPFLDDSTIIYVKSPNDALKVLEMCNYKNIKNEDERFNIFIRHLKDNYLFDDSNWYVIDALEKGIGIYVSPIPRYIKKEIINLFNRNIIKILVVTTAFAEGVNSSAKNIIITNKITGSNKKLTDLDLLNLSGRAGRFGVYSKGNIYSTNKDISETLIKSSKTGVIIDNPNYKIPDNEEIRTNYEIDMIDNYLLSEEEKRIKEEIMQQQEIFKLSDDDLNIALSVSKSIKIKLYSYFYKSIENMEMQNLRFNNIRNLLSSERNDVIESMTFIFNELKTADINISSGFGDISPYNRQGDFIWGKFYGIHSSGNIRDVLKFRKRFIVRQLDEIEKMIGEKLNKLSKKDLETVLSRYDKKWIVDYLTNGEIDDTKLYNGAFKFISNIIEYRIPFYVGLYISVFKMFCKKNELDFSFDFDIVEISTSLENKNVEKKYADMLEFGIPLDTIRKINKFKQENDISTLLDQYEKLMLKEYNYYFEKVDF